MDTSCLRTNTRDVTIRITPYGIELKGRRGETLLDVLRRSGITIDASCGGRGLCGRCRVRILSGIATDPTASEERLLGDSIRVGWRLACQVKLEGDLCIAVPSFKGRILDWALQMRYPIDTAITTIPLGMLKRGLPSDLELLKEALRKAGIECKGFTLRALGRASKLLHEGKAIVVVYDRESGVVIDVREDDECYGIAIDLGTTTLVASLINLRNGEVLDRALEYNSQVTYGRDIISRISYVMSTANGTKELRKALLQTLNNMIMRLIERNHIQEDMVYEIAAAGNTVMSASFLGIPPHNLGTYPFEPPFIGGLSVSNAQIGLNVNQEARVHLLPILGGYVGGDVAGDILSSGMLNDHIAMLIDLGTNGEIVLKNGDKLYVASCAAGPAFEGVGITAGMMATEGAIERIKLNADLEPEYEVIGKLRPKGICGSGLIDLLAELLRHGILDSRGRLKDLGSPRIRANAMGIFEFVVEWGRNTATGEDIVLTQQDVRQLQLAKAAVKAAYEVLLRKTGIKPEELQAVYVAGGFGNFLDPQNALRIGLIPPVNLDKVKFIGNGSLAGAQMYIISIEARRRLHKILKAIEHIELNQEPDFKDAFMRSLSF